VRPYVSFSAAAILAALRDGHQHGFDIMDVLGLPSGTVYPALRRMEEAGFVESRWEPAETAQRQARPPRKYYRLTRSGRDALAEAARRYRLPEPAPSSNPRPARARR
jgi:DNA-binding PadR family transcriptional regulator